MTGEEEAEGKGRKGSCQTGTLNTGTGAGENAGTSSRTTAGETAGAGSTLLSMAAAYTRILLDQESNNYTVVGLGGIFW